MAHDCLVWMRAGDQDNYHSFDSVEEAAADLTAYLGPTINDSMAITRYEGKMYVGISIADAGYHGENGISLFWGDEDAELIEPLSDYEIGVFSRTVYAG